jgi:hypothetical protein
VFRAAGGISEVANLSSPTPVATALTHDDGVLPANPVQDGIIGTARGHDQVGGHHAGETTVAVHVRTARLRKIAA